MNRILKGCLIHFIYVPLGFILILYREREFDSALFGTFVTFIFSLGLVSYNFILTYLFSEIISSAKFILYLTPAILLLLFHSILIDFFDSIGPTGNIVYFVLIINLAGNIFTYFYVNSQVKKSEMEDILDN